MKKHTQRIAALMLSLLLLAGMLAGCGAQPETPAEPTAEPTAEPVAEPAADAADLVLTNGTIQTMVSEDDTAEAVAVKNGEIVYVGTSEGVKDFIGEGTNVIDLAGKYVTPGFIDGHIHAPGPYLTRETVLSLMEYGADLEAYKAAAKEFVDSHPDYDIYLIEAFDLKAFPDSIPENSWLDEICADKPIKCTDVSTHGALLNTCAIEMCGITKDTPNPPKGVIYKDSAGELTGYFSDCNTILGDLPSFNYTEEQYAEAFKAFQSEASSYGLTGIDSGGNLDNFDLGFETKVFHTLEAAGELNLRINSNFFFFAPLNAERAQTVIDTIRENEKYASDFLNVRQVKFTVDGVPEGKSAFLLEPYDEAAGMDADYVSSPAASPEELKEFITAVNAAGYTVQTHCMGDASVKIAMDAYENSAKVNGNPDVRNKIAHVNLLTDEDVDRMAEYKVIAAMQPLWFYYDPFFSPLEEQMFGTERFEREYHIRDMIDAGVIITGSNDYPVTLDFAPLHAIEAGATQCSPYAGEDQDIETYTRNAAQAATVYEMLEMYTVNAAYGAFLNDRVGTIEVGKKADLVVLGDNLLTCDVKAISDVPVIYTISDGRIVYEG